MRANVFFTSCRCVCMCVVLLCCMIMNVIAQLHGKYDQGFALCRMCDCKLYLPIAAVVFDVALFVVVHEVCAQCVIVYGILLCCDVQYRKTSAVSFFVEMRCRIINLPQCRQNCDRIELLCEYA
jgi:hypothetical protein